MRPRKTDRHLPPCVYLRSETYYYVKRNQWRSLGKDLALALREYARLIAQPAGGMQALIEEALPGILAGKAQQTTAQYKVAARRLQEAFAEFAPQQVTPRDIVMLRRAYADSPASANRLLVVLRQVFDYALEEAIVDSNPVVGIKSLPQTARDRLVTEQEFAALRDAAPPRFALVLDLCYLTGQRIGDVVSIHRNDITERGVYFRQQKTGKRLLVAWTDELKATVDAAIALQGDTPSLWLFKGPQGRHMSYTMARKDWLKCLKSTGIKDVVLHDIRARAATQAEEQGQDPTKLLGHSSPQTTRRYLRGRKVAVVTGPTLKPRRVLEDQ